MEKGERGMGTYILDTAREAVDPLRRELDREGTGAGGVGGGAFSLLLGIGIGREVTTWVT